MALFEVQPTGERKPTRQFWFLFAVVGVLVIAATVGVVLAFRTWQAAQTRRLLQDHTNEQVRDLIATCTTAEDPALCEEQRVTESATALGSVQVCETLEGRAFDNCVWDVARQEDDPEACGHMQDKEMANQCADGLWVALAIKERDPDLCRKASAEETRAGCDSAVRREIAEESGCAAAGLDQSYCDGRDQLQAAISAQDPALCEAMADESLRAECVESVGVGDPDLDGLESDREENIGTDPRNADTDSDGLNDFEEVEVWETDPFNPDSDGDTFADGQEVAAGYDPRGPGILE